MHEPTFEALESRTSNLRRHVEQLLGWAEDQKLPDSVLNDLGVGLYARKISLCWNHFFKGTSLTYIRGIDDATPFLLHGIPGFDGKK